MTHGTVPLRSLAGCAILFEGDLQDLARFILRACDARWQGTHCKQRPTLHGLVATYARIIDGVDVDSIEHALRAHGFDLGSTVEYGVEAAQPAAPADGPKRARR